MVAVAAEHRLDHVKVDGGHLGRQNGIALVEHLLGELGAVVIQRHRPGADVLLTPHVHGGQQAADADTGRAQVVHLVDLQHGIELIALFQDLTHLIGGDGVQAAAEGEELHQLQIVPSAHELRRGVQPGVEHPLIHHPQGTLGRGVQGQTVLGEHIQAVGGDELRDAVVDLRVDVVGPSRQHHATLAAALHLRKAAAALGPDVLLGPTLLRPRGTGGGADFGGGDAPHVAAQLHQPILRRFLAGKGDEGPDIPHLSGGDGLHVVFQVLGVGHHHGAVIVILGVLRLLILIEHAGVEDGGDPMLHQPFYMAVGQLGGIALRLGGDGLHAHLVDGPGGEGGHHHPEAQLAEEGGPIGEVFIQVQHPRDADDTARGFFLRKRRIAKQPLSLIGHQVGTGLGGVGVLHPLFAAIAGDIAAAVGEGVHRQQAVILAPAAAGGFRRIGQSGDVGEVQRLRGLAVIAVTGDQRRAEGAHQSGDIGAHRVHTGDTLKGPQHRLIIEGAALHHDVAAQLMGVGQLDDLEQGVLDDGVGKSGGDIRHRRALLLGLLHVGVHEHGAAGAQIHRMPGEQGLVGELRRREAQGIGKVFQK